MSPQTIWNSAARRTAKLHRILLSLVPGITESPDFHIKHPILAEFVLLLFVGAALSTAALFFTPLFLLSTKQPTVTFRHENQSPKQFQASITLLVGTLGSAYLYGLIGWYAAQRLYRSFFLRTADQQAAPGPILRSIGTFYVSTIVCFAIMYSFLASIQPAKAFNTCKYLSFWEALYYSIVTASTVGFGDIAPTSAWTRGLTVLEIFLTLFCAVFFFSILASVMREATQGAPRPLTREEIAAIVRTEIQSALTEHANKQDDEGDRS